MTGAWNGNNTESGDGADGTVDGGSVTIAEPLPGKAAQGEAAFGEVATGGAA